MFLWYKNAHICLVYLDVESVTDLKESRWITKGWTLQELIAPQKVDFYNKSWNAIGSKHSIAGDLSRVTKIDQVVLMERTTLEHFSIATRMSWAASRNTARLEDRAYCLMGMFNVNIPILYGEGAEKAFIRLQEMISETINDQSILAWKRGCSPPPDQHGLQGISGAGLLAPDPWYFKNQKIVALFHRGSTALSITKGGLKTLVPVIKEWNKQIQDFDIYAMVNCRFEGCVDSRVGMPLLYPSEHAGRTYYLNSNRPLVPISLE